MSSKFDKLFGIYSLYFLDLINIAVLNPNSIDELFIILPFSNFIKLSKF